MRILIVGNLEGYVTMAAKIALSRGLKVGQTQDITSALNELRQGNGADLLLVDLKLDIADIVQKLTNERITVHVVACGIAGDPSEAARAIRAGASEYIPLPPDPELIAAVFEAISDTDKPLIFKDPKMEEWLKLADRIAPSEATVLITGESGTGKEVMARYIHKKSKRSKKPFVSVNCAAIPENLLESELFGYEKGAFTGAVARRIGKFEEANGGTLLLDEISEMHPRLQAKLLRAIQERQIDRVGGNQSIRVDIRIIATSNRDLLAATKLHEFREDLYFRLNVMNIQLPPLRERPQDILVLADYFVKKYAELNHIFPKVFSEKAREALVSAPWPGSVRELENLVHRALLLAAGDCIEPHDVLYPGSSVAKVSLAKSHDNYMDHLIGKSVSDVEKELILGTLTHCLGNRTHAASILGISIRTLRNKLKEYGQTLDDDADAPLAIGQKK